MKTFIDCTLGGGGHSYEIVKQYPSIETHIGIDTDPTAHGISRTRLIELQRDNLNTILVRKNFRHLHGILTEVLGSSNNVADGILLDLGVSSMQLDTASRGFSFAKDGPLDMRLDPSTLLTAEEIVNSWSEMQLGRIIRDYGGEKQWRLVARRISEARSAESLSSTLQLSDIIGRTIKRRDVGKMIHPATRTFQALRIAVNEELRVIEEVLPAAANALKPGGRLAVITFHSLEDRIAKQFFRLLDNEEDVNKNKSRVLKHEEELDEDESVTSLKKIPLKNSFRVLTQKPVVPTKAEISFNPRSRSAKLRIIECI
eukprot:CAMPEP_0175068642 /NCGR_PEP_ID=MMETSP0052_2-20121109/17780_1 /TAXON_ID=51329 ORGANISM="Polytomella parva, Strain SAG 63-3" /NCGR_SAMPLE_ID=MMETSP0052_2 /ASSEMBLY_ACC=CAM_ASM_000194 /LENGTH=313 /DNA_ID=CAMNT_0016335683 /DNA_START=107 /DNA_END=1048 /DNA_ORIENTATION=+